MKVGAARNQERNLGCDRLEDVATCRARAGELGVGWKNRDLREQMGGTDRLRGRIKEGGFFRIRLAPGLEGLLPLVRAAHEALLVLGKIGADLVTHKEVLACGKAEAGP